jgi:hypothetical protein
MSAAEEYRLGRIESGRGLVVADVMGWHRSRRGSGDAKPRPAQFPRHPVAAESPGPNPSLKPNSIPFIMPVTDVAQKMLLKKIWLRKDIKNMDDDAKYEVRRNDQEQY